jgi:amidohydrolase
MDVKKKLWVVVCLTLWCATASSRSQDVPELVKHQMPELISAYKELHENPELSHFEVKTSAWLAGQLRSAGYTVTENVGRYNDGSQAYGVVGVMKNGKGKTLLLRTDMDALPVIEKTDLPYASKVRTKNAAGQEVGVMHACGHDVHLTTMVGVARVMAVEKTKWHGTLILIGQPSEELAEGAQAMLSDDLYQRFGRPDVALVLHDNASLAAGMVGITSGPAMASSTTVFVTMRGVGGHGAMPASTKDPVVMAAEFVTAVQTIVSRQTLPTHPAVVTVGTIHGGTQSNIIPDEVKMGLSVRALDETTRKNVLEEIQRTADGVALIAGVPAERKPQVEVAHFTSPIYNDPMLTARVRHVLTDALGADNVLDLEPVMVSEDFGLFGLPDHAIPTVLFWLGAVDPVKVAASVTSGVPLPSLHSSMFAPLPELTLSTGVTAMSDAALDLLK